jgi:hypothetical protein
VRSCDGLLFVCCVGVDVIGVQWWGACDILLLLLLLLLVPLYRLLLPCDV